MSKTKRPILQFTIAVCGVIFVLFGLRSFYKDQMMSFSLAPRMILMIVTYWMFFLPPGVLMWVNREKLSDLGFTKEKIIQQILIGVLLALLMSLFLTVLPILLGFKNIISSTIYTQTWQFVYQFVYMIFGVAIPEELVFRGYLFNKLLEIRNSRWFAIIISSSLFGLFHILNGYLPQVFSTAIIGLIFCICREKIKGCTLLSLIVAHGVYGAMIVLWASCLK